MTPSEIKTHRLSDPVATCGDRVYVIGSQNGLFPDSWGGHVPHEMNGVWAHPIKLLDGFWFGVAQHGKPETHWLSEAHACRAYPTFTEFYYQVGTLHITRRDFVPDGIVGLVISLAIHTNEAFAQPITLTAHFRSDLRPVWLGERTNMTDSADTAEVADGMALFRDSDNDWACVVTADAEPMTATTRPPSPPQHTHGNTADAQFTYEFKITPAPQHLNFFVAGTMDGTPAALQTLSQLRTEHTDLFDAKAAHYQTLIETSRVITPSSPLNKALLWTKINAQWLLRTVPEIGSGVGAGLPEYPWWFGIDTEYAVLSMLQAGLFEPVRDTLLLLQRESEKCNPTEPGRIIHEMSSNGAVFNEGNAMEAAVYVRAVHQYWQWSGDNDTLRQLYPLCKAAVLSYLLGSCDPDGDLCPSGRSIIETLEMHSGIEALDTATYTCEALARLRDMSDYLGEPTERLHELEHALQTRIVQEWWLESEGLFADIRASKSQVRNALQHLDAQTKALNRDAAGPEFLAQVQQAHAFFVDGFRQHADAPDDQDVHWLLRHWVVLCPLEAGIATPNQAARALARLHTTEFCNEHGMKLHPDRNDAMSINSGLLALAAARYGHTANALRMVENMAHQLSYRTPGTICEALPDQWCFVQLWSNLGVTSPTVECFLGIAPDAARNRLRVVPNLPPAWGTAEVNRLRVGQAFINIRMTREANVFTLEISASDESPSLNALEIELGMVLREGETVREMKLNGQTIQPKHSAQNNGACATCVMRGVAQGKLRLRVVLG